VLVDIYFLAHADPCKMNGPMWLQVCDLML
jgi:hypothetical protein